MVSFVFNVHYRKRVLSARSSIFTIRQVPTHTHEDDWAFVMPPEERIGRPNGHRFTLPRPIPVFRNTTPETCHRVLACQRGASAVTPEEARVAPIMRAARTQLAHVRGVHGMDRPGYDLRTRLRVPWAPILRIGRFPSSWHPITSFRIARVSPRIRATTLAVMSVWPALASSRPPVADRQLHC